jgi:hypothetical protein
VGGIALGAGQPVPQALANWPAALEARAPQAPPKDWCQLALWQRIVATAAESFVRSLSNEAAGFLTDPPQRKEGLF